MKNYKVVLYSEEERFVFALMNYINHNSQIPILAMAFTGMDDLNVYLESHRPDLIVGEMNSELSLIATPMRIPVLWMAEEGRENCISEASAVLQKYSSASVYVRRMLQMLSEKKILVSTEGTATCVAVYSPIGRCGKTELSNALCRYYSRDEGCSGRQCIYLGWEEFPIALDENRSMEEMLYYLKQRRENISMRLKTLAMEEQGYDKIPSASSYQELRELERKDLAWFLEQIRTEGYYNWLVADIGSGCLSDFGLLTEFDVIYLPYLQRKDALQKLESFVWSVSNQGIWSTMAEICYPVLMKEPRVSLEEIRRLEQNRLEGKLVSIGKGGDVFGHGTDLQ